MSKRGAKLRVHEWSWGYVGIRTVCGQTPARSSGAKVVRDLGEIESTYRCQNCERMRSAIGTSSKP